MAMARETKTFHLPMRCCIEAIDPSTNPLMLGAPLTAVPDIVCVHASVIAFDPPPPCGASYHVGQNRNGGTHGSHSLLSSRIRIRVTVKNIFAIEALFFGTYAFAQVHQC